MSDKNSNGPGDEFRQLKESMSSENWTNPEYLAELAQKLQDTNLPVSLRLLQRVKHLKQLETNRLSKKIRRQSKKLDSLQESETASRKPEASKVEGSNNEVKSPKLEQKNTTNPTQSDQNDTNIVNDVNLKERVRSYIIKPIFLLVAVPWLLFTLYQVLWASPRYESQAKIIVKQPDAMATMDTGMALLSGLGVNSVSTDAKLIEAYIYSVDMLNYIEQQLSLRKHYGSSNADFFSRLSTDSSQEDLLAFYKEHVKVEIDEKSQVITLLVQGFTPEYANKLNQLLVDRAEWYINEISRKLASEQLEFIQGEHEVVEKRLADIKHSLLQLQNKYQLLDPETEGIALQKIAYSIEAKIAEKKSELQVLSEVLSDKSSQVSLLKSELKVLEQQLEFERERLSSLHGESSVSEILSQFADLKVNLELAISAYASSQISLEKSRVEAYRQIKYLVIIESPTFPQDNAYPKILYNLTLCLAVLLMLFGIGAIINSTVKELS